MSSKMFNPCDISSYSEYFKNDRESQQCQSDFQDTVYGEYIATYGYDVEFYLIENFNGEKVFEEDTTKKYMDIPFNIRVMFEPTGQTKVIGMHDITAQEDEIILYVHKSTARCHILQNLIDNGLVDPETIPDYSIEGMNGLTDIEKWRRDLQEGDCFFIKYSGIVYEIDGIVEEPEFQHMYYKYIYQVHARPKLMSSEITGNAMPVDTEAEDKINKNQTDLEIEGGVILF